MSLIRPQGQICYAPRVLYKPQFAYKPRPGFRQESFVLPFSFQVPADGKLYENFPWKLDDDVPYLLKGMVFPQIGTSAQVLPSLVRLRDTYGNPMSNGLVLSFGAQGQSGYAGINAFGFPFDCEVECEKGGVILFDFQIDANSTPGPGVAGLSIAAGALFVAANIYGVIGNTYSIALVNPGTANHALTVAVSGTEVIVTLATNAGSVITSTYAQIAAAINASPVGSALLVATSVSATVAVALPQTPLNGGAPAVTVAIQGTLLGAKLWKDC
jgi:hypothetical protein